MRQTTNKNLTKQILTLALAFVMVFTGMGIGSWGVDTAWAGETGSTTTSAAWDGKTATEPAQVDDVYQIGTGAELAWFAAQSQTLSGINAKLTDDINLGGHEWTPIGAYMMQYGGSFDGNNHTIKNLKITQLPATATLQPYVGGLFVSTRYGAEIKNLTIEGNITIDETNYNKDNTNVRRRGGLVGYATGGTYINCVNKVNIEIKGNIDIEGQTSRFVYIGGLFGDLDATDATVIGCTNLGDIIYNAESSSGDNIIYAGGIAGTVGQFRGGKIDASLNKGTVTGTVQGQGNFYCGGITGRLASKGQINNSYSIGNLHVANADTTQITVAGGIAGYIKNDAKYPTQCTYLVGKAGAGVYDETGAPVESNVSGILQKTTEELQSEAFLKQCNSAEPLTKYAIVWKQGEDRYPEVESITHINSAPTFFSGTQTTVETSIEPNENYSINLSEIFYDVDGDPITYTVKLNDAEPADTTNSYVFNGGSLGVNTLVFYASDGKLQSEPYTVIIDVRPPAFEGTGSKDDPYIINSSTALKDFSEKYNKNPEKYKGKYWKQTAEIDMKGMSYVPVGIETAFSGFYDGNGYKITNLAISSSANAVGLFALAEGETVIENIVVSKSCTIRGDANGCCIGSIVGIILDDRVLIQNCTNYAMVESNAPAGAFAGIKVSSAGGIVGSADGTILYCKNYGKISQSTPFTHRAGGITGHTPHGGMIVGCENHGDVCAESSDMTVSGSTAGGIVAKAAYKDISTCVSGCFNTGNISAGLYVGGIVGDLQSKGTIENSYNLGTISGNTDATGGNPPFLGGITGGMSKATLKYNYNVGKIQAHANAQTSRCGEINGSGAFSAKETGEYNYFIGTEVVAGTAYGYATKTAKKKIGENAYVPSTTEQLQSEDVVRQLNTYTNPISCYKTTWEKDNDKTNQGYPKIIKVESKLSHYAEMKSFTVTINGTEYKGVISGTNIDIVLPAETTNITPTMTVSEKATVTPASGGTVSLTNGSAQFTVTAENGINKQVYTLHATVPQDASGLAALKLTSYPDEILAASAFSQQQKDYPITLSDSKVVGRTLIISAIPATSGATMTVQLNDAAEISLTAASSLSERSGSIELWKSGAQTQPVHVGANTLTIKVTPAGSSEATVYTINIDIQPTLSVLSVKNGEEELAFNKAFDGDATTYSLDVWDNVNSLTLSAKERMTGIAQVTLPAGTKEDGLLDITNLDRFEVKVGDAQASTTYTVTLNKKATFKAEIAVTPKDAIVVVLDAAGKTMQPNADGSYTLAKEETYTVRAAKAGYRTIDQTFKETSLKDGKLTLSLNDTSSSLPSFTGDWTSFRGSDTNNGVTAAKTPKTANAAKELWAVKLGTGYANAPTPQLLINGHLYLQSGKKLYILDPKTGDTLKSTTLMGSSSYTTNPVAYGGGMIFVSIDDGNDSYIQALNAETLESLWVSEKVSGQLITPVTYHNGYLYTGTWNGEKQTGTYYMLSATDEDTAKPDETKKVLWKLDHKGGFYWAGAYATDKYVVFGSDDGTGESDSESAVLYSVNPLNGAVISKITGLKGDIRSSITYQDGYVYFTTKAAILYRVAIDADGKLGEVESFDMGSKDGLMSTGTPVISDGVVFVSRNGKGTDQFSGIGAVYAIDAKTMERIAEVDNDGYIQSSMLLSTAYKESDKALYLYATYNKEPGGMLVIKYDLEKKTLSKEALYTPTGDKRQYNICSPIADASGNIYFKNDSGYIFAIGARDADEKQIATVNFVLNGGSAIGISEGSAKTYYSSDEGQTLPIPSKNGYTFKGWFSENNNTSQASKQYTQISAGLPGTLYAIWEKVKKPTQEEGNIKVTFRLIGAEQAKQAVDLSKNTYLPNYVTWISTKTYTVKAGTTVGEVFKKALGEAGIDYHGYERNYINEIKAPTSLGGYWLGEFDNGRKSGWMYTVNGTHPNKGLVEWTLNNGDDIVWHYVNDYSFEVADWFPDPDYPSLAKDARYYNGWLKASDTVGSSGGGAAAGAVEEVKAVTTDTKTATTTSPTEVKVSEKTAADGTKEKVAEVKVSADNQKEILKQAKANKSKEIILSVATKAVGDATKAEVTLDKSFIDSIVKDTDAKLTVKTPFGDKTYTQDELKALSEAATGSTITVSIEKAAEEPADDAVKAEKIAKAKSIVKNMKLVARSSKTAKKNVKAVLKSDAKTKASVQELKDLGFTVKYRFYRSTKKASSYKSAVTKKTAFYTNTSGKKGTKYFYKVQIRVYDENGKLVAKTALKQCKYASRTWTK